MKEKMEHRQEHQRDINLGEEIWEKVKELTNELRKEEGKESGGSFLDTQQEALEIVATGLTMNDLNERQKKTVNERAEALFNRRKRYLKGVFKEDFNEREDAVRKEAERQAFIEFITGKIPLIEEEGAE